MLTEVNLTFQFSGVWRHMCFGRNFPMSLRNVSNFISYQSFTQTLVTFYRTPRAKETLNFKFFFFFCLSLHFHYSYSCFHPISVLFNFQDILFLSSPLFVHCLLLFLVETLNINFIFQLNYRKIFLK